MCPEGALPGRLGRPGRQARWLGHHERPCRQIGPCRSLPVLVLGGDLQWHQTSARYGGKSRQGTPARSEQVFQVLGGSMGIVLVLVWPGLFH